MPPTTTVALAFALACCTLAAPAPAQNAAAPSLDKQVAAVHAPGLIHSAIGVTRQGTAIPCLVHEDDLDLSTKKTRVLLVGGLDSSPDTVQTALDATRWFYTSPDAAPLRERFILSAVPCLNPDAYAKTNVSGNNAGGHPGIGFPPEGNSYNSPTDPENQYVWRWIGMHAPDYVVVVMPAGSRYNPAQPGTLWVELPKHAAAEVGTAPAAAVQAKAGESAEAYLKRALAGTPKGTPLPARLELQRRLTRSPIQIAQQLAKRYGHQLNEVSYIPALALIGRLHLGDLTNDQTQPADVLRIVEPYVAGRKPTFKGTPSGPAMAGHLVFGELAERDRPHRDAYVALLKAACVVALDDAGNARNNVPNHSQMSDSVFMACAPLARAGAVTGDSAYWNACLNHLRFMRKLCARDDGLYRHSPLDEAAWGRGNGFPALGLALALSDIPADFPGRNDMLEAFCGHMAALVKHQDYTGCWHQVIDHPESYREFTATCMITFAMVRGVRRGWLPEEAYKPVIFRGWHAIRTRIAPDATLVDVCTGTGKQKTLRDYLDRTAILGPDPRGGAMALMVATEIAQWQAEQN
jgi:unsaturated rhamnogalacturonyl hydrolase